MREESRDLVRIGLTIALIIFSAAAFYYALFWGWASGAGSPPNAHQLERSSNLALAASFLSFWGAVAIWVVPYARRRLQSRRRRHVHPV
jgi:hypothetical protein